MQHVYRKGYHAVGTAGYGIVTITALQKVLQWRPRSKKLAECSEMADSYDRYAVLLGKYKSLSVKDKVTTKGINLLKKMEKEEDAGKAAWEVCKASLKRQGRGDEADSWDAEQDLQDGGYIPADVSETGSRSLLAIGLGGAAALGLIAYLATR